MFARKEVFGVATTCVALAISGCATNRSTVDSFYESSYEEGTIERLAVPGVRNAQLAPSQSQLIGRRLNQAILKKNSNLAIVSANQFNEFLNERGMVDKYADFLDDYTTSGIANEEFTEVLRKNGIDGILISALTRIQQTDGQYGYSGNRGTTRVTLSFAVIDTSNNQIVWSASADGISKTATKVEPAPPIARAVKASMSKVVETVPSL